MIHSVWNKLKGHPHLAQGTAYAILFTMGTCHLLNDMIQSVIPALYPLLKDSFGFTFAQIGIITLVFQLTSSIFQPFIGLYADRYPQPYSLSLGMCFTLAGLLALAFATHFLLILLSVALIGCGSSVFHPEASRVAQLASGGRKSLAQSIFQVGGNGGSAIGPLLAALIVIPFGQHAVAWFALAALLASFLLARVGYWYSLVLRRAGASRRAGGVAASPLPRRVVRVSLGILVLMIFSKYFFNACMTSYFTFYLIEKFGLSVQQSQYCLFAYLAAFAVGTLQVRHPLLHPGRSPLHPGHALPGAGGHAGDGCHHRSGDCLGLFRHRGLCHRPHAGQGRYGSRHLLRPDVWPGRHRLGFLRLAGGRDEHWVHLPCQHLAAADGRGGGLPAGCAAGAVEGRSCCPLTAFPIYPSFYGHLS